MEAIRVKYNGFEERGEAIIIPAGRPLKFTVPATGEKVEIDDIVYIIFPSGIKNYRVQIVTKINEQSFTDFMHWNVRSSSYTGNFTGLDGTKYTIASKDFCQPIEQGELDAIIADPKRVIFLNSQLETSNPSSPLNSEIKDYISITSREKGVKCTSCGSILKNNAGNLSLLTRICASCAEIKPELFAEKLSEIKSSQYNYYIKKDNEVSYSGFKTKKIGRISPYYKMIDSTKINEEIDLIPKIEKDLICLGLGSAGSGILDQLMKTNMVEDYVLVDFDKIEKKNTRNQIYNLNHLFSYKADAMADFLTNMGKKAIRYTSKFQDVNFKLIKSKYIILGFDTIQTRLEALEKIKTKEIEVEYIIDTRYLDLECSIYFVDTSKENEMNYYEKLLLNDLEYFNLQKESKEKEIKEEIILPYTPCTVDNLVKYWNDKGYFNLGCGRATSKIVGRNGTWCTNISNLNNDRCCSGCTTHCKTLKNNNMFTFCNYINSNKKNIEGLTDFTNCPEDVIIPEIELPFEGNSYGDTPADTTIAEENTCLKMNIIDIYKFASSFITSAMREIFEEREKPFTHVECQTSIFPSFMKVR